MFILHGTFQAFILSAVLSADWNLQQGLSGDELNCFSILNKVNPYLWMELLVFS